MNTLNNNIQFNNYINNEIKTNINNISFNNNHDNNNINPNNLNIFTKSNNLNYLNIKSVYLKKIRKKPIHFSRITNRNTYNNNFNKNKNKLFYILSLNSNRYNEMNFYNYNKSLVEYLNNKVKTIDKKNIKKTDQKYSKYTILKNYLVELEKKSYNPIDLNSLSL
jgi:hypothetical protein